MGTYSRNDIISYGLTKDALVKSMKNRFGAENKSWYVKKNGFSHGTNKNGDGNGGRK